MMREARDEASVEIDKLTKNHISFLFEGISQSAAPMIFTCLVCETMTSRYSILVFSNLHFSG
jgi:hypothetical protein